MSKPRLLDLFCCQGGAAMGYSEAGFEVVGVDVEPQPRYPFEFHQADAMEFPLDGFDAVHASPPCQAYSAAQSLQGRSHPELLVPTLERLRASGLPFVVENVEGATRKVWKTWTLMLCGTMFDIHVDRLALRRHRFFECNFYVKPLRCDHDGSRTVVSVFGGHAEPRSSKYRGNTKRLTWSVFGHGGVKEQRLDRLTPAVREANELAGLIGNAELARKLMEMPWATQQGCSEAIPPAYTRHIGRYLMKEIERGR